MKADESVQEAWPPPSLVEEIRDSLGGRESEVGLVLGSGLGGIADALEDSWTRPAREMEGYPESSVAGHEGRLHLGRFGGHMVWLVQGRVHLYEGHTAERATRYVRLLHALGVRNLILTNAAGAAEKRVGPGSIVLADDAVSMFFRPLSQAGASSEDGTGPTAAWRMRSALSDPDLIGLAENVGRARKIAFTRGVLVGASGPCYETAAEIRLWQRLGGTVASMSTVPEAIVARELGMRILMFSLVTNYGTGLSRESLTHEDVVRQADAAGQRLRDLLEGIVAGI